MEKSMGEPKSAKIGESTHKNNKTKKNQQKKKKKKTTQKKRGKALGSTGIGQDWERKAEKKSVIWAFRTIRTHVQSHVGTPSVNGRKGLICGGIKKKNSWEEKKRGTRREGKGKRERKPEKI